MQIRLIFALALASSTSLSVAGQPSESLLQALSLELQSARSLPQGAQAAFRCPKDGAILIGTRNEAIRKALGEPDFVEPNDARGSVSSPRWTYSFTGVRPAGERGGGFPELRQR
jgi:hypothetical protein